MEKAELQNMIFSGSAGIATSILHGFYRGILQSWKDIVIKSMIGALVVYATYLVSGVMGWDADLKLFAGFLAGMLNEHLVDAVYKRDGQIISRVLGPEDKEEEEKKEEGQEA